MAECLLVIDVQRGFEERTEERTNPTAESNIARLLAAFRKAGRPVIHVRHASIEPNSPLRPELPGHAPSAVAVEQPGEPVLVKSVNDAFAGTDLERRLRDGGLTRIITVGVQTDHCVSTTVRQGSDLGFDMVLVDDATWTYARHHPDGTLIDAATMQRVNVASLSGEFCDVTTTDEVIAELS
ncbi:MAG: cysteine hydrolase family protein [Acidimicrobiia bacterium]